MAGILSETRLTFSQAAKLLPSLKGTSPVAPQSVWRWATRGFKGIRLEYLKCGGVAVTSKEALERFFAKLTEADQAQYADLPSGSKRCEAAERELDAAGIA